jgi:hypothetical protein
MLVGKRSTLAGAAQLPSTAGAEDARASPAAAVVEGTSFTNLVTVQGAKRPAESKESLIAEVENVRDKTGRTVDAGEGAAAPAISAKEPRYPAAAAGKYGAEAGAEEGASEAHRREAQIL